MSIYPITANSTLKTRNYLQLWKLSLTWLHLLESELPVLVKQRYGLRSRKLASIKPAILQALPSLLDESRAAEEKIILTSDVSPDSQEPVQVRVQQSNKTVDRVPFTKK